MLKRYRLLCLAMALVAICSIRLAQDLPTAQAVVTGFLHREPFHAGRPLSYWVSQTKFKDDMTPMTVAEDPDASDGFVERETAWKVLLHMGDPGIRALCGLLHDDKVIVRHRAVAALGDVGERGKIAIPALLREIEREGDLLRAMETASQAGHGWHGRGPDDSNPAFVALTRLLAIESVYHIDRNEHKYTPQLVSALVDTLLYTNDDAIKQHAWRDLRGMDPRAEVPAWVPLQVSTSAFGPVSARAEALCRLREADALTASDRRRTPEAVLGLAETLARSNDLWVREAAWQGMRLLDPAAEINGLSLVESLKKEPGGEAAADFLTQAFRLRQAEAYYQYTRDRQATTGALMEILVRSTDEWIEGVALMDMRLIDPEAKTPVAPLVAALEREKPDGVRLAAKAGDLGRLRRAEGYLGEDNTRAPEVVKSLAELLLHGHDKWLRNTAWRDLDNLDPTGSLRAPFFTEALKDPSPEVRSVATLALARLEKAKPASAPHP